MQGWVHLVEADTAHLDSPEHLPAPVPVRTPPLCSLLRPACPLHTPCMRLPACPLSVCYQQASPVHPHHSRSAGLSRGRCGVCWGQADLNGDGTREVIVATRDAKLQVLSPPKTHSATGDFASAAVVAEVSLRPANVRIGAGRRPVALAVGFLDPPPPPSARTQLRKQVRTAMKKLRIVTVGI
jgi:hypothetical protein